MRCLLLSLVCHSITTSLPSTVQSTVSFHLIFGNSFFFTRHLLIVARKPKQQIRLFSVDCTADSPISQGDLSCRLMPPSNLLQIPSVSCLLQTARHEKKPPKTESILPFSWNWMGPSFSCAYVIQSFRTQKCKILGVFFTNPDVF